MGRKWYATLLFYLCVLGIALVVLFPFLWMLRTAFSICVQVHRTFRSRVRSGTNRLLACF